MAEADFRAGNHQRSAGGRPGIRAQEPGAWACNGQRVAIAGGTGFRAAGDVTASHRPEVTARGIEEVIVEKGAHGERGVPWERADDPGVTKCRARGWGRTRRRSGR